MNTPIFAKNYGNNGSDFQGSNACNTNFVYSNCNPLDRTQWKYQTNKVPQGMDPTYFNVMNGCWICNNAQEIAENQYLCNRNFFSGPFSFDMRQFGTSNNEIIKQVPMLPPGNAYRNVNYHHPTIAYSQLYSIAHKQMARDCIPNHSVRFAHKQNKQ